MLHRPLAVLAGRFRLVGAGRARLHHAGPLFRPSPAGARGEGSVIHVPGQECCPRARLHTRQAVVSMVGAGGFEPPTLRTTSATSRCRFDGSICPFQRILSTTGPTVNSSHSLSSSRTLTPFLSAACTRALIPFLREFAYVEDLRHLILRHARDGTLPEYLGTARASEAHLIETLVELHNSNEFDLVAIYRHQALSGPQFFLACRAFDIALPRLNAQTVDVLHCIAQLAKRRGNDMTSTLDLDAFTSFCKANAERPHLAVAAIEADPALALALPYALIAGWSIDPHHFVNRATQLIDAPDLRIRRQAAASLRHVEVQGNEMLMGEVSSALLAGAAHPDDELSATCAESTAFLLERGLLSPETADAALKPVLARNTDLSVHLASRLLAFRIRGVSTTGRRACLLALQQVAPKNGMTVEFLDIGLVELARSSLLDDALALLQNLLSREDPALRLERFSHFVGFIQQDPKLQQIVITRQLLDGTLAVCRDLPLLLDRADEDRNSRIEIYKPHIIGLSDPATVLLARKIVGYLFPRPIAATSLLLSLARATRHRSAKAAIVELIRMPMMLNYTGSVVDYVKASLPKLRGKLRETCERATESIAEYLRNITTAGRVEALEPTDRQRQMSARHFSARMAQSLRSAEKKSPLMSIMSKQTILYSGAVVQMPHPKHRSNRIETKMQSHSISVDHPRIATLDPIGLDYLLKAFRAMRLKT